MLAKDTDDREANDLGFVMLKKSSAFVPKLEEILSCGHETTLAGGKTLAFS